MKLQARSRVIKSWNTFWKQSSQFTKTKTKEPRDETPDETTDEDVTIFSPMPTEIELLHQHVTTVARLDTSEETAERG